MDILVIQTGGTIDKDYPKKTNGFSFEICDSAAEKILKRINPGFTYEILSLLKKDSLEITDDDRSQILDCCKNSVYNKIIITHGTDTMEKTALALSGISEKTIIITGALIPETFKNSDADFNIGFAVAAAQTAPFGTWIAMNGKLLKPGFIKRNLHNGAFEEL